jgi:penicillin amidase
MKLPGVKLPKLPSGAWLRSMRFPSLSAPQSRWPRRIARGLLALLIFIVALGLISVLSLRHSLKASLPQLDGTLHIAGLSQRVAITRDAQAVPSITAANMDDLLFAQGFTTAQDRLWQMDALRRHASGELAEILGPSLVEHDRRERVLQMRSAADNAIAAMPADQLHQLEAYARGVNAFLSAKDTVLPVEFHLLHYKPEPWQPRDSILVLLAMWQDLATTFPHKMLRETLAQHLPETLDADLYPVGSFRDRPPSDPRRDLSEPVGEIEQIPLDSSQSSLHASPRDLLRINDALATHDCEDCVSGSNNWAVAAARSASGAPLVSNDMHLGLSAPDIWYEASLHIADHTLNAAGFTLPGVPFIVVGRNTHVAWSFTNLGGDVQDVYIEHLRGKGDGTEFERADSTWQPVEHHTETIRVRFGRDVKLDVQTTSHKLGTKTLHTPIISALYPSEKRTLSLAWTIYDPDTLHPNFRAINTAASGAALVASFASFGGPSLNLIYADDARHMGYHAIGQIPIRGSLDHHSRSVPSLGMPGVPVLQTPETEETEPEAALSTASPFTLADFESSAHPRLLTAGFVASRHRKTPTRESRRATNPRPRKPAPRVEPEPTPTTDIVAAKQSPTEYTVGSPLFTTPVDALNPAAQWAGYVPYDELPSIVDPPDGILATANARITPGDYPYFLTNEWVDAYRVERIHTRLQGRTALTPADMLQVQLDTHSALDEFLAERLSYAIDHASKDGLGHDAVQLHSAADILRRWDGNVTTDSPAAAIIANFRRVVWQALLVPQILAHDHLKPNDHRAAELAELYAWQTSNTALESLLNHQPQRWLPPGFRNWDDFLSAVLAEALRTGGAPRNLASWKYGSIHTVSIDHPILGSRTLLAKLLGVQAGSGDQPIPGDTTTIRATAHAFGPSERFTADLASPDATTANITTGQSGNPASPNYLDQFLPWLNGGTFALPLTSTASSHILTLEP